MESCRNDYDYNCYSCSCEDINTLVPGAELNSRLIFDYAKSVIVMFWNYFSWEALNSYSKYKTCEAFQETYCNAFWPTQVKVG